MMEETPSFQRLTRYLTSLAATKRSEIQSRTHSDETLVGAIYYQGAIESSGRMVSLISEAEEPTAELLMFESCRGEETSSVFFLSVFQHLTDRESCVQSIASLASTQLEPIR